MKPGSLVTKGKSRCLPDGAVVQDVHGVRWTLVRPTGAGATRRWRHDYRGDRTAANLFEFAGPVTLVSLPEPSGDGG